MQRGKLFCLIVCLFFVYGCKQQPKDYAAHIDLFIGTGANGHTHPGAVVPNGMIQPGPDNVSWGWNACSGYHYSSEKLYGFSHTHLSGTGGTDYGDFLVLPIVGHPNEPAPTPEEEKKRKEWMKQMFKMWRKPYQDPGPRQLLRWPQTLSNISLFQSPFSHDREMAEPGYYSVKLDRYGVKVELTATERTALHRYTYPATDTAGIILDLDYTQQKQTNIDIQFEIVNPTTIRAYRRSGYWAYDQEVFFYAEFSKPFIAHEIVRDTLNEEPECKVYFQFAPLKEGEQILMKAAISAVDYEGAKKNLEAEMPGWDFEGTRKEARRKWNECLAQVEAESADSAVLTNFYTAMYHAHIHPSLFMDVDGRYRGMDLEIHQGNVKDPNYTVFSLWDTFRALHPLLSILNPQQNEAYIRCLLQKAKEGGIVPKWELVSNYTGTMIGYHFASLAADAYAKGARNFDVKAALEACLHVAEYDTARVTKKMPRSMMKDVMPVGRYYKNLLGYIPCDKEVESVAKALEYAYNDWCIAVLAKGLGEKETAEKYSKFAKAYEHYYDSVTGFMRGKLSNGEWRTPFDPHHSVHRSDDYCEGTAYQWSWFVPHDVPGLMQLMGGESVFAARLDSLFSASSHLTGAASGDISGLIGQYAHGNEPSHHIIHLYNYANRPWRTQELVDSVLYSQYHNTPEGLSGNEDCGQMSAWYILNAMGFYQICPGEPIYSIGRPILNQAKINLRNGKTFTIRTVNNSRQNKYIASIQLNGKKLDKPFFTHEDLMKGGELVIEMSANH